MRKARIALTLALVLSVGLPTHAYGWSLIGHFIITKAAGFPTIARYAQLPDYVSSWKLISLPGWPEPVNVGDINLYFCWSHGVQDAGDTGKVIPIEFTYPDDGRYQGQVMWQLLNSQKLKCSATEAELEQMEKTAKGFIAHNAADRAVHCNYFKAPKKGDSFEAAGYTWLVQHYYKEKWADYWIYIREYCNNDSNAAFDQDGKLVLTGDLANGVPVADVSNPEVGDPAAWIMQLAQKLDKKNRRKTEKDKDYHVIEWQRIAKIKQCVSQTINDKASAEALRNTYTRGGFELCQALAELNGWYPDELFDLQSGQYKEAKDNVTNWLNALQE